MDCLDIILLPLFCFKAVSRQGHKRFHGAFEGGFSAGYFNTVGSKEGWTPSEFRSSRRGDDGSGRQPATTQSIQDFMDEEDLEVTFLVMCSSPQQL